MSTIKKILKFVSSRALYLALGVFLASAFVAYAAWENAKTTTTNPGELSESNWNALVDDFHAKCDSDCDAGYTVAQATGSQLTEPNWNGLIEMMSQFEGSLYAGNIKLGETIFGVAGSYNGPASVYYWSIGEWGSCSDACSVGTQTRIVVCVDDNEEVYDDSNCAEEKPDTIQDCGVSCTILASNYDCGGCPFGTWWYNGIAQLCSLGSGNVGQMSTVSVSGPWVGQPNAQCGYWWNFGQPTQTWSPSYWQICSCP